MPKRCGLGAKEARSLIKKRVRVLRSHVEAAREGDEDGIHDLRVASRRLRAALGENADLMGEVEQRQLSGHVADVTRLLGAARELDVSIGLLNALAKGPDDLPKPAIAYVTQRLAVLRQNESPAVIEGAGLIESPEFNAALVAVFEHITPGRQCYLEEVRKRLRKRYRRLVKAHSHWREEPSEDALHRIRVGFKKLRYGCELYRGLYGAPMKKLLKQLKGAQESLGDWNDYRVLRDYVQRFSPAVELPPPAVGGVPPAGVPKLCAVVDARAAALLKAFRASSGQFFAPRKVKEIDALLEKTRRTCCRFKS